jgi:CTP synthase
MLSYVPIPHNIGEMKTKPTQYASRELNSVGLQADVILGARDRAYRPKRKEKIALFCNVLPERERVDSISTRPKRTSTL